MAPFKRSDKREWYVKIPDGKRWIPRSTGTTRKAPASRIDEAVRLLHPKEGHGLDELLKAVLAGTVPLSDLGKDSRPSALRRLQADLGDEDLSGRIEAWHEAVSAKRSKDTADHYRVAVYECFGHHEIRASKVTRAHLQEWLDKAGGERNTRRKKAAGVASFLKYLVARGKLVTNPMRDVELPPVGKPREKYLETPDAEQLVKSQYDDYRALAALMAGSGIEVSVALALRIRQVDREHREVFAPGTKTHARQRTVRVADWAWPYFEAVLEGKEPDDRVFKIPNRWYARTLTPTRSSIWSALERNSTRATP